MGTRYLLDTNVILDFMGNNFPANVKRIIFEIIDVEINLSVINKIELLGFSRVEQDLIDFVNYSNIFAMDDDIVDKTIEIRRLYKIKLPDAIIAATALVHGFELVSHNVKDFHHIRGLQVFDPYSEK
ncbi:MAG: type II toxin-antitoxin system VapC family toxin [Bacteroidales bacterium]|jgi:predicted nucleic acid-binding protein|nr:type II toxin-antitoxin system VapC family toxin [Bacteroidales bacterium]